MGAPLTIASTVKLNSGHSMPLLGLGFWKGSSDAALTAFELGYRHIDSARVYGNEGEMGEAARKSGLKREELFLTTKVKWQEADRASAAIDESLHTLGLDYVDLYLLHNPGPKSGKDGRLKAWKALEEGKKAGKIKSIGVSNFEVSDLEELQEAGLTLPSINQIELHPWIQHKETVDYCKKRGIFIQAYCPLARVQRMKDPVLVKIAEREGKTPAQCLLRWSLQHEFAPLPKSANPERLKENADIYDFTLSEESMKELDACDMGREGSVVHITDY